MTCKGHINDNPSQCYDISKEDREKRLKTYLKDKLKRGVITGSEFDFIIAANRINIDVHIDEPIKVSETNRIYRTMIISFGTIQRDINS